MDKIIDFFNGFNIQTILAMTVVLWYFTRDIRNEIKSEIKAIKEEIQVIREENTNQSNRSDRLYEMFIDLLKERK